jgi:hypothetical protein
MCQNFLNPWIRVCFRTCSSRILVLLYISLGLLGQCRIMFPIPDPLLYNDLWRTGMLYFLWEPYYAYCYGLNCASSKFMCWNFNLWYLRIWLYLETVLLKKWKIKIQLNIRMSPNVICVMFLHEKEETVDAHIQRKCRVRSQWESINLCAAKETDLRRNWACWHLDRGLQTSRHMRK